MSTLPQSTKRKLSLLQLAEELDNVSKACQVMGHHRDTYYEMHRAFRQGGRDALLEQKRGPKGPHPNRVAPEVEEKVLSHALEHPTLGCQRVANELRMMNVPISAGGVRGVWLRHDLETRNKRLLRLEREARKETFVLSEKQIALLERHSVDFRCRHVESSRPGELLNQDTFYWGTLKGVGKVYVQVVANVFCSPAFAKLYTSKPAITAADLLYDRVFPFYEALGVCAGALLTDNGREYCGRSESHPYEELWEIRRFPDYYNHQRTHQGYRLEAGTPVQALAEDSITQTQPDPTPGGPVSGKYLDCTKLGCLFPAGEIFKKTEGKASNQVWMPHQQCAERLHVLLLPSDHGKDFKTGKRRAEGVFKKLDA